MRVDTVRDVFKERNKWKAVFYTYLDGNKHQMYVCALDIVNL